MRALYSLSVAILVAGNCVSGLWFEKDPKVMEVIRQEFIYVDKPSLDQVFQKELVSASENSSKQGKSLGNAEKADLVILELDIFATVEQYLRKFIQSISKSIRKKRTYSYGYGRLLWPNATIPYKIYPMQFNQKELQLLRIAMSQWEHFTCIKFKKEEGTGHFVEFQGKIGGCLSQIGYSQTISPQIVRLHSPGCSNLPTYLHTLGHIIGLSHEFNSPDRDNYITINFNKTTSSENFRKRRYDEDVYNVEYDFTSLMHFGLKAFSIDGSQTIFAKDKRNEELISTQAGKEIRFKDIKLVNLMYKCNAKCTADIRCSDGGFVNKDCKCFCKDGTNSCQEGGLKLPTTGTDCKNTLSDEKCEIMKRGGQCSRNAVYVLPNCKKACGMCGVDFKGSKQRAKGYCENRHGDETCSILAFAWFCDHFPAYMMSECTQACGFCDQKDKAVCKNLWNSTECDVYANFGYCRTSKEWMVAHCRQSCGICDRTDSSCTNQYKDDAKCYAYALGGECLGNIKWMYKNCRRACGICQGLPGVLCKNVHSSEDECVQDAHYGLCGSNNRWMVMKCMKACHHFLCHDGPEGCDNKYGDQCTAWAQSGQCTVNPFFMFYYCEKACSEYLCSETAPYDPCVNKLSDNECNEEMVATCGSKISTNAHCYRTCSGCGRDEIADKTHDDCINLDADDICWDLAVKGRCELSVEAKRRCRRSCTGCGGDQDTGKDCLDTSPACGANHMLGLCGLEPESMKKDCKKTCGFCTPTKYKQALHDANTRLCKDDIDVSLYGERTCQKYFDQGECAKNEWVRNNCKRTCGRCLDKAPPALARSPVMYSAVTCSNVENIHVTNEGDDPHFECRLWASSGHCTGAVAGLCRRTCECEKCYDVDERHCRAKAEKGGCSPKSQDDKTWMNVHCRKTCGLCRSNGVPQYAPARAPVKSNTSSPGTDCSTATNNHVSKGLDPNSECKIWAASGHCSKAPYVEKECKKTCECCKCFDVGDKICKLRAEAGLCSVVERGNKAWMERHCAKTCQFCKVNADCLPKPSNTRQLDNETPMTSEFCSKAVNKYKTSDKPDDPDYECRLWTAIGHCIPGSSVWSGCQKTCQCDKCFDVDEAKCISMAKTWGCTSKNKGWMKRNCAKTCKTCGSNKENVAMAPMQMPIRPESKEQLATVATETYDNCFHVSNILRLQNSYNPDYHCKKRAANGGCDTRFMQKKCAKTCTCETCFDVVESECIKARGEGRCDTSDPNYGWMKRHCALTCGLCHPKALFLLPEISNYGAVGGMYDRDGKWFVSKWTESCCDFEPDCNVLAKVSCKSSKEVRQKCPKSCGTCVSQCHDDPEWGSSTCKQKKKSWCEDRRYEPLRTAYEMCPVTCGFCIPCPA